VFTKALPANGHIPSQYVDVDSALGVLAPCGNLKYFDFKNGKLKSFSL
jgi:hypothetical protein